MRDVIELRYGDIVPVEYMQQNQHVAVVPLPIPDAMVERAAMALATREGMPGMTGTYGEWYRNTARMMIEAALTPT